MVNSKSVTIYTRNDKGVRAILAYMPLLRRIVVSDTTSFIETIRLLFCVLCGTRRQSTIQFTTCNRAEKGRESESEDRRGRVIDRERVDAHLGVS